MTVLAYDDVWVREPRLMVPGEAPVGPVTLDRQNSDCRGLITYCVGRTNLVDNALGTVAGGARFGSGKSGPGWVLDGGADSRVYWPALRNTVTGTQEVTIEALVDLSATSSLGAIFGLYYSQDVVGATYGANGRFRSYLSYTGSGLLDIYFWGAGNDYDSGVSFVAGKQHLVITKAAGTAAVQISVYRNGVLAAQGNSSNSAAFADFTAYPVIGHRHSAAAGTFTGVSYLCAAYDRLLSAAEVARLAADPFARVRPA